MPGQLPRRFLIEERGEDLVEYGLLAAFAASVAVGVLAANSTSAKAALSTVFERVVAVVFSL